MTAPPPPAQPGLPVQPGVGKAQRCEASRLPFAHRPARWVWHHILPQACGGKTVPENLAALCDNCHYATHAALYALATTGKIPPGFTRGVRKLAQQGFEAAQAAGTTAKIPREG